MKRDEARIPAAPDAIEKGASLASLLGPEAIACLAANIRRVHPGFPHKAFTRDALAGIAPLGIMARAAFLAEILQRHLPPVYSDAAGILVDSLGPELKETSGHGMAPFFYLPHVKFVALYGLDARRNAGKDPFETSMRAQHEITRRFTAEFSMRPFLIHQTERTIKRLTKWTRDPNPHVRRLCSEGSRPRLPWAERLPAFVNDPTPLIPILEALKDDPDLFVRRSVANHVGDIAKDHLPLALDLCRSWLQGASEERRWVIRHAVRHPAKKGNAGAIELRVLAGGRK